jgi:hypothetical protein
MDMKVHGSALGVPVAAKLIERLVWQLRPAIPENEVRFSTSVLLRIHVLAVSAT